MRSSHELPARVYASLSLVALLLGVLFLLPRLGWGQTVSLQAQVIYATNQPGGVDSRLGNLAGELQKSLPYKTYQLLDVPRGSAALNQTWQTRLPDDRSLEITPTAIQEGQYSVRVRVVGPGGQQTVNTVVRLRRGSTFLISKGAPHKDGALIIAISVN